MYKCESDTYFVFPYVVCEDGDLRLVNQTSSFDGHVEFCINNTFGAVCDDFWDHQDALVVCQQLGFSNGNAYVILQLVCGYFL